MEGGTARIYMEYGIADVSVGSAQDVEKRIRTLYEAENKGNAAVDAVLRRAERILKAFPDIRVPSSAPRVPIAPRKISLWFSLDENLRIYVRRPDVPYADLLLGKKRPLETIVVVKDGIEYIVRRGGTDEEGTARHYAQASDEGTEVGAILIVRVLTKEEVTETSLLDRGVCWVQGRGPAPAIVSFNLEHLDKHGAEGEISSMILRVEEKVREELADIFRRSMKRRVAK